MDLTRARGKKKVPKGDGKQVNGPPGGQGILTREDKQAEGERGQKIWAK